MAHKFTLAATVFICAMSVASLALANAAGEPPATAAQDAASSHGGHSGDDSGDHGPAFDEFRPFDAGADAMADVDAALIAAQSTGKRPLLVLGGNWCHDSRGIAAKFADSELAAIIEAHFLLVYVDVGRRDRNLEVAQRFGVDRIIGTPTIIVLSPQGELLNPASVHDWRNAAARTREETREFLLSFVDE
ncbi:MAG: thioredoxin family protein [Parvularculaceae bacterium]|nr:thioredoxin family protein [Parvularculaceae bacterium]